MFRLSEDVVVKSMAKIYDTYHEGDACSSLYAM
jgi:hypothetical protein